MFFVVHINVFVFPFQWNEVTEQWDKVSLSFSVASYMYLYFCFELYAAQIETHRKIYS